MRIIICDYLEDAKKCKDRLSKLSEKYKIGIEIRIVESGKQLLFSMESEYPNVDFIYLNCYLPDANGVEIAERLRQHDKSTDIIFYSKDTKYIADGYDVNALNFLVKNKVSDEKFAKVFLEAVCRAQKRKEEVLSVFCAGENRKIDISDISYFEVNKRIVTVHYGRGKSFEFYSALSKLENVLCNKGFLRIHQSYLVAEKHIRKSTKDTIFLEDDTFLPIGRSFQRKVKEMR